MNQLLPVRASIGLWPHTDPRDSTDIIPPEALAVAIDGLAGDAILISADEAAAIRRIGYPREVKSWARRMTNLSVERGKIERPDRCDGCGRWAKKIEIHHLDYAEPWEMEWLCKKCHDLAHGRDTVMLNRVLGAVALALFRGINPRLILESPARSEAPCQ